MDKGDRLIPALMDEHGGAVLAYATRLTGNRSTAEDIVQETMLRAWRHAGELSAGTGSVRGWLMTVARNLSIDKARAVAARPAEVAQAPHRPPVQADHAQSVVDGLDLLGALRALSAKHRQIILELYYHDRTAAEAADLLGIPVGTVKSRAHNALRALRDHLDRQTRIEAAREAREAC